MQLREEIFSFRIESKIAPQLGHTYKGSERAFQYSRTSTYDQIHYGFVGMHEGQQALSST
jgi:hypothetical protein